MAFLASDVATPVLESIAGLPEMSDRYLAGLAELVALYEQDKGRDA